MGISAGKGTRPRRPADQRYGNTCLLGAICPKRRTGAAPVRPHANTEAMQLHLDGISKYGARKAHAVGLMDRAGWHSTGKRIVAKNLTIILLPSKSPELNPVENVWQSLRSNDLSNRIFKDDTAIVDATGDACNAFMDKPRTITSIRTRDRAHA